jgi:hypothetical protein
MLRRVGIAIRLHHDRNKWVHRIGEIIGLRGGYWRWEAQEKARIEMTLKDNVASAAHDDLVGAAKDKADKGNVKGKFFAFKGRYLQTARAAPSPTTIRVEWWRSTPSNSL